MAAKKTSQEVAWSILITDLIRKILEITKRIGPAVESKQNWCKSKHLRMKIEGDKSRVCDDTSWAPFLPLNFLVWLLVSFLFTWSNNRNDEVQKQKHWKLAEAKRGTTGILHCVNKDDFHLSLLFIWWLLIFTTVFLLNGAALLNISCSTGQGQIFSRDRWSVSWIWSLRLPWQ